MKWISCKTRWSSNPVGLMREKIIKVRGNIECKSSLSDRIWWCRRDAEDWDTGDETTLHILIW